MGFGATSLPLVTRGTAWFGVKSQLTGFFNQRVAYAFTKSLLSDLIEFRLNLLNLVFKIFLAKQSLLQEA